MSLHVHHAHRAELLVDALADVLAVPPVDPFAPEVVAVPSRGIERWIAQRLAHRLGATAGRGDGIAANIAFPFPGGLSADVLAHATGVDAATDPWRPERLVWPLLDVVTEAWSDGDEARIGPLAEHTRPTGDRPDDRRLGAVRRVAALFDRYAVHRPAMLRGWADGRVVGPDGRPLDERWAWQRWLWCRLVERLTVAPAPTRLETATAALRSGSREDGQPLALPLPERLAVFGVTALSATAIEVLSALADSRSPTGATRDVHLFVRHPSPAAWRATAPLLTTWRARHADRPDGRHAVAATTATVLPTREHDPTAQVPSDPLLAAWGRDSRELQVVIDGVEADRHDHGGELPPPPADATLLQRLQDGVVADRPRTRDTTRPALADHDRSVQLHRCHGPAQQVEVLRDVVLHVLREAPDLEPRDVLVQCPDIETYAPLIEAVFGTRTTVDEGRPSLRVQLADRALTRTNPLLRVLAEVLDLVQGRMTGSAVLDLCTRAPVRRRFALDEDDLATVEGWLETTAVRWGLDGDHRAALDVPTDVSTWQRGLDRLLAGAAAADEQLRTVAGIAPEDDVEGDQVELAGRLAELIARLHDATAAAAAPRPIGAWLDLLREVLDRLALPDPAAPWQQEGVDRALEELRDAVRGTPADAGHLPLTLREVRDLLGDRLAGAPSRASHRTGDLTVCTLVPMRSVPHEVVIWLGMDDEVFPRRTVPDGDDLLASAPLVGDRDPRTEDRQLLLDALLAAGRRLVVLTTGHDERTGEPRPPAVPVGELLDAIDRTVDAPSGHQRASAAVTIDHPLQPFDPDRFTPGGLGPAGRPPVAGDVPFGHDVDELAAARAAVAPRRAPDPLLRERLVPVDDAGRLDLDDLVAFYRHPIAALLRQRLEVTFPRDGDRRSDAIAVELGGLSKWAVGDRLLADLLDGHDPDRSLLLQRLRGGLPPGDLADDVVTEVHETVEALLTFAHDHHVPLDTDAVAHPIDVTLPDGRRLTGSVPVVDGCRRSVSYATVRPKHRLSAWLELLALTVSDPERPWRAVTLGRSPVKDRLARVAVLRPAATTTIRNGQKAATVDNPLGPADQPPADRRAAALALLTGLVELRDRGLCGPLLLPCDTAGGYAETALKVDLEVSRAAPRIAARDAWTIHPRAGFTGEDLDPAHLRVLGHLDVDQLLAIEPEPDEDGDAWPPDPSRLGRTARRVWTPLLCAEEVTDA